MTSATKPERPAKVCGFCGKTIPKTKGHPDRRTTMSEPDVIVKCGDRIRVEDGDTGVVVRIESELVGYAEHGVPQVETNVKMRVDASFLVPITTWVRPEEILEVLS